MKRKVVKTIEDTEPLVLAIESIEAIDPVVERIKDVDDDFRIIYKRFMKELKASETPKELIDGLKFLISYKQWLSRDPLTLITAIKSMKPAERKLAAAVAKRSRLTKQIAKEKDPQVLFGKK